MNRLRPLRLLQRLTAQRELIQLLLWQQQSISPFPLSLCVHRSQCHQVILSYTFGNVNLCDAHGSTKNDIYVNVQQLLCYVMIRGEMAEHKGPCDHVIQDFAKREGNHPLIYSGRGSWEDANEAILYQLAKGGAIATD